MRQLWPLLASGVAFFIGGCSILLTGDGGSYHGVPVPNWAWIPLLFVGGWMIVFTIRPWLRDEIDKPEKEYTPQDIDQAKRDLARMYEREHGRPPELWSDPAEDAASLRPEPTEPPLATPPAPEGAAPSLPSPLSPQGEAPPTQTKS